MTSRRVPFGFVLAGMFGVATAQAAWVSTANTPAEAHPNSKLVLLPGDRAALFGDTSTVEVYDASTRTWSNGGTVALLRAGAGFTALSDGRVLIIGGMVTGVPTGLVEAWDPSSKSSVLWDASAAMPTARRSIAAVLLDPGQLMAIGGAVPPSVVGFVELLDVKTRTWTTLSPLNSSRALAGAIEVGGEVLVAGGASSLGPSSTAEVYRGGKWSEFPLSTRVQPTMTAIGRYVLVGGSRSGSTGIVGADVVNLQTLGVSPLLFGNARDTHSATLIGGNLVLVVGGLASNNTAELIDPFAGTTRPAENLPGPCQGHGAVRFSSGEVLVAGGEHKTCSYLYPGGPLSDAGVPTDGAPSDGATSGDARVSQPLGPCDCHQPGAPHGGGGWSALCLAIAAVCAGTRLRRP